MVDQGILSDKAMKEIVEFIDWPEDLEELVLQNWNGLFHDYPKEYLPAKKGEGIALAGSGGLGTAFFTRGKKYVVKFTVDETEFDFYSKVEKLRIDSDVFCKALWMRRFSLKKDGSYQFDMIVREYALGTTLEQYENLEDTGMNIFHLHFLKDDKIADQHKMSLTKPKSSKWDETTKRMLEYRIKLQKWAKETDDLQIIAFFRKLYRLSRKGIYFQDLKSGNLGIIGDHIVIFDVGQAVVAI